MKNIFLKRQLERQGASTKDATELAGVSDELKDVIPNLDPKAKKQIAQEIGFKPVRVSNSFRWATGGAFVSLLALVVVAQSAQPGSVLYALKRGTEEVRVIVQPGFDEEDLKQRRQDEQKKDDNKSEDQQGADLHDDSNQDDDRSESDDSHQEEENEVQNPEDPKKVEDPEDRPDEVEQKDSSGEDIPEPEDPSTED